MTAQLQEQRPPDAPHRSFVERDHEYPRETKSMKVYRGLTIAVVLTLIALLVLIQRPQTAVPSEASPRRALFSLPDRSGRDLVFTIRYGFFDGTEVKDPTQEEISGLEIVTARFFRDILKEAYPNMSSFSIEGAKLVKVGPKLRTKYDVALLFKANVSFSSSPTLEQIYDVMISADYTSYITDYVWNAQPKKKSIFYDTQRVYYTKAKPTEFEPTQSPTQEGTIPPTTVWIFLTLQGVLF